VVRLKSLQDVSLDFNLSPLTAIMGSNCCGKTTVLHAIACAFKPLTANDPNYHFPLFFRPNSDALWKESDFTIRYSERVGESIHDNQSQNYRKLSDRWTPKYARRPSRYTRFVSIGESVPDIETVNLTSMIHYTKTETVDDTGQLVREVGGQVLNKVYESFYKVTYAYRGKLSIGVKTPTITYSGLSMSAGEQRVFRILDAVFRAPRYGLILVDEIDLFLHQDALHRMLSILREHCTTKNKQLVFTTHFPPVAEMYENVSIYTLNRTTTKTVVYQGYSYEAMRHITGTQDRPISCYVEDDVAEHIVSRVAAQLGIRRFVKSVRYGCAVNAFSLASGLYFSDQSDDQSLIVLDGDVYGSRTERRTRIRQVVTGDQPMHDEQRRKVMSSVRSLRPAKGATGKALSPEQVLHRMLHAISRDKVPSDRAELHEIALGVVNVPDRHGLVDAIIGNTGESREVALSKVVELASLSPDWARYTRVVRTWLSKKKKDLGL